MGEGSIRRARSAAAAVEQDLSRSRSSSKARASYKQLRLSRCMVLCLCSFFSRGWDETTRRAEIHGQALLVTCRCSIAGSLSISDVLFCGASRSARANGGSGWINLPVRWPGVGLSITNAARGGSRRCLTIAAVTFARRSTAAQRGRTDRGVSIGRCVDWFRHRVGLWHLL